MITEGEWPSDRPASRSGLAHPHWHAVYTRPGDERRVCENLASLAVETLNPQTTAGSGRSHEARRRSLFPRYVFARFGRETHRHVRFARGVVDIVSVAGVPAIVEAPAIAAIRARMDDEGLVRLDPAFSPGDRVIVTDGPFRDFAGVFQRSLNEQQRVAILLTFVCGAVTLAVPRGLLRKASG